MATGVILDPVEVAREVAREAAGAEAVIEAAGAEAVIEAVEGVLCGRTITRDQAIAITLGASMCRVKLPREVAPSGVTKTCVGASRRYLQPVVAGAGQA